MEVKSFKYKNLLGTYYLQTAFSSKKMDDHIAEMLTNGWEIILQGGNPGDGGTFGIGVKRETMTLTFKRG